MSQFQVFNNEAFLIVMNKIGCVVIGSKYKI